MQQVVTSHESLGHLWDFVVTCLITWSSTVQSGPVTSVVSDWFQDRGGHSSYSDI